MNRTETDILLQASQPPTSPDFIAKSGQYSCNMVVLRLHHE